MKIKAVLGMLTLLLVSILLLAFKFVPAKTLATATVTYEYYVVVRAHSDMMPTVPSPAPSPPGFNFTVDPPVFNFGNVMYWDGRTYLYDGFEYSSYYYTHNTTGARVNITNLLGYDITITELTAEVTNGTITNGFFFTPADIWFGNWTIVGVDTLDPGKYDECDYFTGRVEVHRLIDGDRHHKTVGDIQPPGIITTPSLLEPDHLGDAKVTGHVAPKYGGAPITLTAGETFTEYFGVIILGDADVDTQINGTITLSLMYEFTIQGPPVASFTYTPTKPLFNEPVTFNASSSTPNGGIIISHFWDFGDGTNSTGMIINHTYTTQRNYTVVLNVTDTERLSTTNNQSIQIIPEFSSFLILPLFIVATSATVVYLKKRKLKHQ